MSLKRITAFVLCFILAMALIAPASAEEYSYSDVTISYDLAESFSVTIPASVALENVGSNLSKTIDLSVAAVLKEGSGLNLQINGVNYDSDSWFLSKAGSSSVIKYDITIDGEKVVPNIPIALSVNAGNNLISKQITFTAPSSKNRNMVPGSYSSVLTFAICKTG